VADPSTPLLAAYAAWKKIYEGGSRRLRRPREDEARLEPVEKDMLGVIDLGSSWRSSARRRATAKH